MSPSNFGDDISLLRLDNSEFNRKEVTDVLDEDQYIIFLTAEAEAKGPANKGRIEKTGLSNPHWLKMKAM